MILGLIYSFFQLPSGKLVQVRKVSKLEPEDTQPAALVRYVNDDGELSPGEFHLSVRFLMQKARKVMSLA